MRASTLVCGVALCAPYLASARPTSASRLVTDPVLLAELQTRHAEVLELQAHHAGVASASTNKRQEDPITAIAIGVYAIIAAVNAGGDIIAGIANALTQVFGGQDAPWQVPDNCQISFSTQGGEGCYISATPSARSGNTTQVVHQSDWNVCPWPDPANTAPPVQFWTDPGYGHYSVQFTATDTVAWAGINNTQTCVAEGLCNPQFVFFRDQYTILLNSWESVGSISAGQYSGNFNGLCGNGPVKNQFTSGGDVLGYDCAVPCWNDADLPSTGG